MRRHLRRGRRSRKDGVKRREILDRPKEAPRPFHERFMDMTYNMVAGSDYVKSEIKRFMKHDVELNRWQNVRRHHPEAD